MKLDNGRVHFSSYSLYNSITSWLKKKGKRVVPDLPHELHPNGKISLKVEEIPKPTPKIIENDLLH